MVYDWNRHNISTSIDEMMNISFSNCLVHTPFLHATVYAYQFDSALKPIHLFVYHLFSMTIQMK